jgi:lactoylglutathione lyase
MADHTRLSTIVLRVGDLEQAAAFYEALGLSFRREQHASGPVHYSCDLGTVVVELYPGSPGRAGAAGEAGATMLELIVPSLVDAIAGAEAGGGRPITPPKETEWGSVAVLEDPDGRRVRIREVAR